jgi:hypothetical protein
LSDKDKTGDEIRVKVIEAESEDRPKESKSTHRIIAPGFGHNLPQEAPQAFARPHGPSDLDNQLTRSSIAKLRKRKQA